MLQAILIGLIGALGQLDSVIGSLYTFRPIVTGFLVGVVLGDIKTGLILGATLELFFIGSISMGAYIPPDALVGGVLATAFAIHGGLGVEAALALAMPIAVISMGFKNVIYALTTAICAKADDYAAKGNTTGINVIHFGISGIKMLNAFAWCFLGYYLGADVVVNLICGLPEQIVTGLEIAGGILPALGFALLLNMVLNKRSLPYYFLGFVLAASFDASIITVLIIAIIIVVAIWERSKGKEADVNEDF
ncbi:PTS sugar transporter subunit IIC [bacterium 1XD21-13]|nr:PTS sugar transporter subunit IIC [bacterium 1XD21-13]